MTFTIDRAARAMIRVDLARIAAPFLDYDARHDRPCGASAYHNVGKSHPWRLRFADGDCEHFASAEQAEQAAIDHVAALSDFDFGDSR